MSSPPDPAEMSPDLAAKRDRLLDVLSGLGRVGVAFSAGVDSTLVALAARMACGEQAVALTANSASLAEGELDEARALAARIGIRHEVVDTDEFQDPSYLANPVDRCYHCKSELYSRLERLAPTLGFDAIVNGANLDDLGDFRPGMRAAREHAVRSPLVEAGFTKQDVRDLARAWDLPVWDKPAAPCLSSRIATGVAVTPERVARVDRAERFLKERFGIGELRVRLEANELARIEVPVEMLPALVSPEARHEVTQFFLEAGFAEVTLDLRGFRSGGLSRRSVASGTLVSLNSASRDLGPNGS
jgi:pyridinium-3,5-biscarboxylic acid mononucleotide sulfurtransferase